MVRLFFGLMVKKIFLFDIDHLTIQPSNNQTKEQSNQLTIYQFIFA